MSKMLRALYVNETGFVISAELVLVGTVCVLGLVAGLTCVRDAMVGELQDVGAAFRSVRQDYYYTGMHGCPCGPQDPCACQTRAPHSWTAGSCYFDVTPGEQAELGCVDEPLSAGHRLAAEHEPHPAHQHADSERQRDADDDDADDDDDDDHDDGWEENDDDDDDDRGQRWQRQTEHDDDQDQRRPSRLERSHREGDDDRDAEGEHRRERSESSEGSEHRGEEHQQHERSAVEPTPAAESAVDRIGLVEANAVEAESSEK